MNVDTGHLVRDAALTRLLHPLSGGRGQYEPVPAELEHAAKMKLGPAAEAMVSLGSGGKLSRWARKRRRQIANESRRRNR